LIFYSLHFSHIHPLFSIGFSLTHTPSPFH
jgi:hypothetical protein